MTDSSENAPPAERQIAVLERGDAIRTAVLCARRDGKSIGLVPTMGALHEGHLSLVDRAVEACDVTVATIFVNPKQFDQPADLAAYARDLDADVAMLAARGCDYVFAPSVEEMYPPSHDTYVEVGAIGESLEGACRPGHFRGVATVVLKLFNLVPANYAYFGRKDYQQTLVVRKLVDDFDIPIAINICPIVREPDGLAMSSRNARLSPSLRKDATVLSESLSLAADLVASGERNAATIIAKMQERVATRPSARLDYVALVADGTMTPVETIVGPTTALIAAQFGETRLIDNRQIV